MRILHYVAALMHKDPVHNALGQLIRKAISYCVRISEKRSETFYNWLNNDIIYFAAQIADEIALKKIITF